MQELQDGAANSWGGGRAGGGGGGGGVGTPTYYLAKFFSENCIKWKKSDREREGARP